MKRFWVIPLAVSAVAGGLALSGAQAAPATSLLDSFKAGALEQTLVQDVRHRRCHRHCWWHRGHRHCRWRCHRRHRH
jgi:hypothetical protein